MSEPDCRLYLITPPKLDAATFGGRLAEALDAGGVDCVQLRLKDIGDDEIRRAADVLRPIVQDRDVAFIMNDRPDLALETGCDGVHVGMEDAPYDEARALLGADAIVGVTCQNSLERGLILAEAGADYVAFGAFFDTKTKDAKSRADIENLAWWARTMNVPCVAIGGITPLNCGPLVQAGAEFLAVISAIWDHPDGPAAAVREFNDAILENAA